MLPEGTLLTYGGRRYLYLGMGAALALLVSYYFYARDTTPSGSSPGGLIYGGIGFAAILVLMFLGVRKRRYTSRLGTVQGWTSAHVYLGLLTLLVIPMHAGFQFGLDVHTLAFVLLAVVVCSGVVGLRLYLVLPERLTPYEAGMLPDKVDAEINRVLEEMQTLTAVDPAGVMRRQYAKERHRVCGIRAQGWRLLFQRVDGAARLAARRHDLNQMVPQVPAHEKEAFAKFCGLAMQLTALETFLAGQMKAKNTLEAWLYVHLPVSFAMVAAVAVHLLLVFYY